MAIEDTMDAGVAVLGAGPAGLMAAEVAARAGARVTVFDRMPSPARKFLMAGRGGLNLTHSEPETPFRARYEAAREALAPALDAFGPADLRAWCEALGQPTFVGSSGRVFPRALKASPLLRAWLARLSALGVLIRPRHRWTGWAADGALLFAVGDEVVRVPADATVLALGGASWPRLGSDGRWAAALERDGVAVEPLRPSNCGFVADWPEGFRARFAGAPLKPLELVFGGRTVRGEAVITAQGLEGGAVYALSAALRTAIEHDGDALLHLRLRPDLDADAIAARLAAQPAKASTSTRLRKALRLSPAAVALVGDARRRAPGLPLAALVNAVPVRLTAPMPLDRAISSAGGVPWPEVDDTLMLRRRPGVFVAGEMLDWEAPTGGYLLQACFATGALAGRSAAAFRALERFGR